MNKRAVWAIARKDMRSIFANAQVWAPMLILPAIFCLVLPLVLTQIMTYVPLGSGAKVQEMLSMVRHAAGNGAIAAALDAYPDAPQKIVYIALNYLFAPLFLLIPLMASSTISADSFAGEKERGTLETLLFAPIDLLSLFVGKVLASLIPALGLSAISFVVYALVANLGGYRLMHGLFFPGLNWLPLMLVVIPALALLSTLLTVFVSARVANFQAAYQTSGMVVLPAILLVVGQVSGVLMLDLLTITIIGLVVAAVDWILLRTLVRSFDRGYLFESQIR